MRTALCVFLLLCSPLSAYEFIGAKMQSNVVTWSLDKTTPRIRRAVEMALRDWSEVSALVFVEVSSGANINISFDPSGGPMNGVLATTITTLYEDRIVSSDIIINGRDFRWFGRRGYDLRSVVCHEVGHALGLEHSPDPGSLMYGTFQPGEVRSFSVDDILAIIALYGNVKAPEPEAPSLAF